MTNKLQKSQAVSLEEKEAMVIHQAKNNLIDFAIAVNYKYNPNWHHEEIAKELENIEQNGDRDYKVLLIVQPPRHGKSELCSILFPAWYLGKNPDKEVITVSYSGELAQDFGSKTRSLINDRPYQKIFNVRLKEDEQAKAKWKTDKGGSYTSVGVGGAITGRGANILIFDDPIKNREEAESEIYRNKVWQFFTSTAFTRLEPNAVVIVILTRWHLDDLAGRILLNEELSKSCKVIHYPAIKEGQPLWPERYDLEVLESIKNTIGPYDWACTPAETPILMADWTFKSINEIKAGDEVVGFVNGKGKTKTRSMLIKARVKNTFSKIDDIYSLKMESGRIVKCTKDHRWYNGRIEGSEAKGTYRGRKAYLMPKIGRKLMFCISPNVEIKDNQIELWNYFGGIVDGEGHIGANTLNITQAIGKNTPVIERIRETMNLLNLSYNESFSKSKLEKWSDRTQFQLRDCRSIYLKLLKGKFCAKKEQIINRLFEKSHHPIREEDKVLDIKFERKDNVYALETETGNYIAWGYISSNSLYQGNPIISEKQEFKPEWYKYITEEEIGNKQTNKFLTIDTALSKRDQADYCGFCDNEIDKENFWNLRAWRARLNADELIDTLFTLQEKRKYMVIGIEKTAYTDGLKPFLDAEQRKRNRFLPIRELKHNQRAKEIRIRGLIPRYASGSVRHIKGQCNDLEEEQFNFPFGKNDDVLDATAYQLTIARSEFDFSYIIQKEKPNPAL